MQTLHPFTPLPVEIHAAIRFTPGEVHCHFQIRDPGAITLDGLVAQNWPRLHRADDLWRTTCFEAFWGKPGDPHYYELNVAPRDGRWNVYAFDDYRSPQPPRATHDYDMLEIVTHDNALTCRLRGQIKSPLEAALCAVVRTAAGPTYFASHHPGPRADFHDRRGFQLFK